MADWRPLLFRARETRERADERLTSDQCPAQPGDKHGRDALNDGITMSDMTEGDVLDGDVAFEMDENDSIVPRRGAVMPRTKDDGCRFFSSCLNCHLLACVEDGGQKSATMLEWRLACDAAVYENRRRPATLIELGEWLDVPVRTVHRRHAEGMIPASALPATRREIAVGEARERARRQASALLGHEFCMDDGRTLSAGVGERGSRVPVFCPACGQLGVIEKVAGEFDRLVDGDDMQACVAPPALSGEDAQLSLLGADVPGSLVPLFRFDRGERAAVGALDDGTEEMPGGDAEVPQDGPPEHMVDSAQLSLFGVGVAVGATA